MCIYFFCFWFYKLKKIFDSGQNVLKNFNKICKMFKKFKKKFFSDFGWFGERTWYHYYYYWTKLLNCGDFYGLFLKQNA